MNRVWKKFRYYISAILLMISIWFLQYTPLFAQQEQVVEEYDVENYKGEKIYFIENKTNITTYTRAISNKDIIWNYFLNKGFSKAGIAGIMGNLQAESGFAPNNLEDNANDKSGYSDSAFTTAVDNGAITRAQFISSTKFSLYTYSDSSGTYYTYGYGLAQWTFYSRKASLYDYWKSYGGSIGNINMQLDFMYSEMSSSLKNYLKSANNVSDACVYFHNVYEGSADTAAQISGRVANAEAIYKEYGGNPTLNVENVTFPESILQGDTYASTGKIVSSEKITWAWIGILDMSTEQYVTHDEVAPNAKTYDILASTKKLKISSLKPGKYKFCISATTESGFNKSRMVAKEFTVVSLGTEGVSFPDTIEQGKGYASAGKIVSNEKITWAWVGILDMNTELYVTHDEIGPNATTYDISSSTRKLNVSSLEPGKYKFCISATTESGINRSRMIAKEFTVVPSNKIIFDLQGGTVGKSFTSHNIANINGPRNEKTLVVYDNANAISNTNTYGSEALVNNKGTVTKFREFGSADKLTISTDGMVVSGHSDGRAFISSLSLGNYVGFDREAMKVYAYDDYDAYLVNHKYVMAGNQYGELPVPEKEGYYFAGWFTDKTGGEEITVLSQYSVNKLYARWSDKPQPVDAMNYNGHTYEVYDYSMSWEDAKNFCELRGGHLVTVTTKDENAKLVELMAKGKKGYYLIGAESKAVQGKWNWVTGEKFSYSNWDTQATEGNTAAERYAAIISIDCPPNKQNGEWIDIYNVIDTPNYYYYYSNGGFVCEIESVEHIHTVVKTDRVEPTCTTDGKTEGSYCSSCGETIKKPEVIKAKGHSWKKEGLTIESTCTAEGVITYTCSCGATKTEQVPKTGHTWNNATCDKPRTCNICGQTEGKALGHTNKTTTTKATTKANGKIETKCSRCSYVSKKTDIYRPSKVVLSAAAYTYNGKTKTPTVKVTDAAGKVISASNYSAKYASGRKNVGKYAVTVTFKGNYSGSLSQSFVINPKATSISKLSKAKKAFTVKWKKQSKQVTGYQIQYSTNKKFTNAKTVTFKKYKTTSKKITKLSKKKTYYVRVRTYKTVGKTKFYSGWSKVKSVKTK